MTWNIPRKGIFVSTVRLEDRYTHRRLCLSAPPHVWIQLEWIHAARCSAFPAHREGAEEHTERAMR
jgi:hypothetical protein